MLYVGGGTLNADACAELLELAEVGRLPVVTTLMGKSAFPETHELHFGWPGMHGPKWSNWAMNKCDLLVAVGARFDDRVTGQALGLRAGRDGRPPRHRLCRDRKAPPGGYPRGRPAEAGAGRPRGRAARTPWDGCVARTEPWLRQLAAWREEFPLRYRPRRRHAEAAAGARDAPGSSPPEGRRRLDDGRRPAPDVGDAVPALRPAALVHHLGRARHDGLRRAGRDRRQGGAARGDRRMRRRRRLLPDDGPGARDLGARGPARSSSSSSTTATSAWSASGRTCSSTSASRRST